MHKETTSTGVDVWKGGGGREKEKEKRNKKRKKTSTSVVDGANGYLRATSTVSLVGKKEKKKKRKNLDESSRRGKWLSPCHQHSLVGWKKEKEKKEKKTSTRVVGGANGDLLATITVTFVPALVKWK